MRLRYTVAGLLALTFAVAVAAAIGRTAGSSYLLLAIHAFAPTLLWVSLRPFNWLETADRLAVYRRSLWALFILLPVAAVFLPPDAAPGYLCYHIWTCLYLWTIQHVVLVTMFE